MSECFFLADELATEAFGAKLAQLCKPGMIVFLQGELGAGKTTLTRGFLRALGYGGMVKSPTYTLVETYHFADKVIHHFDFYRLRDPCELEHLGLNDYLTAEAICLIEWPENAGSYLPVAAVYCKIETPRDKVGRQVTVTPGQSIEIIRLCENE